MFPPQLLLPKRLEAHIHYDAEDHCNHGNHASVGASTDATASDCRGSAAAVLNFWQAKRRRTAVKGDDDDAREPPLLLSRWLITEYRWPRPVDHDETLARSAAACEEAEAPHAAELADEAAAAHEALQANADQLRRAGALMIENVDAYSAAKCLRERLELPPHRVTLVTWGSPRVELADGTESHPRWGAAAVQKAHAFQALARVP